jgi:FkbM family methyltransferase
LSQFLFTIDLDGNYTKLIDICSDFENFYKLFPSNVESKINNNENNQIIIEEVIKFSVLNYQVSQKTLCEKIKENHIQLKILSGPLKNTIIFLKFNKKDNFTQIIVEVDLKTSFQFLPLRGYVKKRYTNAFTGVLQKANALSFLTNKNNWTDSIKNNGETLLISYKNYDSLLFSKWYHSEMTDIFYKELYSFLPVFEKVVLDIGANIGDSSMYFALNGAKKVISLEPYPLNHKIAEKNFFDNNLNNKIKLLLAGYSSTCKDITIDPTRKGITAKLEEVNKGKIIPTFNLKTLIEKYEIVDGVLKLDCEGCEYDVILNSSKDELQKFSHMIIEFDNGFKDMKKKLEDCNFSVEIKNAYLHVTRN